MTRSRQSAARRDMNRRPGRPSVPEPVWSLPPGTRLLSLDVFGAALDRLVLTPADIHGLVAGELAAAGTPPPAAYAELRLTAERQAWRRARRAGRGFIGLADIADELVGLLPTGGADPVALVRLAISREVTLERRLSRPNPEALAAIEQARRQRVPVAFMADTYLPRDLVAALLRGAGLPAELVLVSSHEGATKDSGDLFHHLASRAGVPLDRIVHLGPDPAIDVTGPTRLGIDARRFVPAHRSVAADLAGGVDEPSALDSVALALAARRLGAPPAESPPSADGMGPNPAPEVGYGVAGPLSVGFAAWVGAQIDDHQPDLVLFADAAAHRTRALVHDLRPDLSPGRLRPLPVVSADSVNRLMDDELGGPGGPADPRVLVVGLGWPDQEHRQVSGVLAGTGARTTTVGGAYLGLTEPADPRERVEAWAFNAGPDEPVPAESSGARDLLASLVAPAEGCHDLARGIDDFARDLAPWLTDGGASLTAALATPALQLLERQLLDRAAASGADRTAGAPDRRSRVPGRHR